MKLNFRRLRGLQLAVSASTVIAVGLAYGISPSSVLPMIFDFNVESNDLNNVFRSIMGLYFGFATYWIVGFFRDEAWRGATISNILFMGGLSSGRVVSLVVDGFPSDAYILGLIAEILFMIWGIYNLYYFSTHKNKH
jgi:Domain of unknown function (DUF4345)